MLAAAEMYVRGVSTRWVEAVFQTMGVENYSAEQVSNAARRLDEELSKWRSRTITQCVKVLFVDATYQKVRIDGHGPVRITDKTLALSQRIPTLTLPETSVPHLPF